MSKLTGITLTDGGMNNVVLPHLLRDGESEHIRNLYLGKDGALHDINRAVVLLNIANTVFSGAVKIEQWKPSKVPIDCVDDFVYLVFYSNGNVALVYRGVEDAVMYYVYMIALCSSPYKRLAVLLAAEPADVNGNAGGTTPTNAATYLSRRYFNGTEITITAPESGGTVDEYTYGFYRWLDAAGEPIETARAIELTIAGNISIAAEYVILPFIKIENPIGTPITDLGNFYAMLETPSEVKSYYVGGIGISEGENIEIFPSESFDISLDNENWEEAATSGSILIPAVTANAEMTQIFVRYVPRSEE